VKICKYFLIGIGFIFLPGCANFNSVTKKKTLSDSIETVFIDAKQRVVYTNNREDDSGAYTLPVFCAEPSPDALSVLAASGGVDVTTKSGLNAAAQGALSEAGGSIGLRTQSIQLMRDAMYRICEGYANSALDEANFETLHRRFQQSMVTILAVEQLTGAVRPPALILAAGAGTDSESILTTSANAQKLQNEWKDRQKEVNEAKENATKNDTKIATLKETISKKESAAAPQDASAEKAELATAEKNKSDLDKAVSDTTVAEATAKENYEAADDLRQQAILNGSSSSAGGALLASPAQQITAEAATQVASAVKEIVKDYNDLTFIKEVCTTMLTSFVDAKNNDARQHLMTPLYHMIDSNGERVTHSFLSLCTEEIGDRISQEAKRVVEKRTLVNTEQEKIEKKQIELSALESRLDTRQKTYNQTSAALEKAINDGKQLRNDKAQLEATYQEQQNNFRQLQTSYEKLKLDFNSIRDSSGVLSTQIKEEAARTQKVVALAENTVGSQKARRALCENEQSRLAIINEPVTRQECEKRLASQAGELGPDLQSKIIDDLGEISKALDQLDFSSVDEIDQQ